MPFWQATEKPAVPKTMKTILQTYRCISNYSLQNPDGRYCYEKKEKTQ